VARAQGPSRVNLMEKSTELRSIPGALIGLTDPLQSAALFTIPVTRTHLLNGALDIVKRRDAADVIGECSADQIGTDSGR